VSPNRLLGATECGTRFRSTAPYPAASKRPVRIDRKASRQDRGLAFGGEEAQVFWSEKREQERQAAVGRELDFACERAQWEDDSLAEYESLRASGSLNEAIVALIQAGDLKPRSTEFWEAIERAAEMLWVVHPWTPSNAESKLRFEYLIGLRNRIKGWEI